RHQSRVWAKRRDLTDLLVPAPGPGVDEPAGTGRLWVGTYEGRDVLVPRATSVMAIAPTRTGKSTRLVIPNLLRWDG
ncbi:type IV secretory system conjugative DNA transfer family protein, partial [Salmonella enterica]|uniref:type IV secretory system conjugative DNA transfer family protein n=1 Tax=Salmonella enterica TaxID=28901 RepID=UPI0039EAFFC1